jgi:hypothetical protein
MYEELEGMIQDIRKGVKNLTVKDIMGGVMGAAGLYVIYVLMSIGLS